MQRLSSRYTHVPLAAASVLTLFVAIAGLLVHRMDGWDAMRHLGAPEHAIVSIPAAPPNSTPALADPPASAPLLAVLDAADPRRPSSASPGSTERYALETGPFASAELADRVEDQLNRLGHATVRFRKQDTTHLYVVTLTGFPSAEEARLAVRQLGRGTIVSAADASEVMVAQLGSLGEAVAAARPLRARGFEVRVSEALTPAAIYYVRYGQFDRRTAAQVLRDALARSGIRSRIVKVG